MKTFFLTPFFRVLSKTIMMAALPALLLAACNNSHKENNAAVEKVKKDSVFVPKSTQPDMNELLTIAHMNESRDGKNVEFRFYERQAIYSIDKTDNAYGSNVDLLNEALKNNTPVRFSTNPLTLAVAKITKATAEEVRAYNTGNGPNSPSMKLKGADLVSIDVSKIDTAAFNRADFQIRFPVFKLCTNVVPNYATLVDIFNYCASQGCNNPPPYTITNCIPFQYVIDGCYARAHKMRQMISKKYGYCVEKVFSFAYPPPNKLAVKANMWGGCCVEWWYHVVPLLRLNVKSKFGVAYQLCYVIDPGMFTTPVTLSTWLQAQKNTGCNPNANVTSYSIQPGSAYWPSFYGSTNSFSTDPNYTYTEQTLIDYKNLHTCN
jgi:Glutaminase